MNNNENIFRLIEAVETSGADIAPTYAEYIQLAFAIATDLGEGGREAFHRLCRLSAKYDRAHADTVYTGALKNTRGDVHLGTAFHLAERAGVKIGYDIAKRTDANGENVNTVNTVNTLHTPSLTHTCAREDVMDIDDSTDENIPGSEPRQALPVFPDADWPQPLMAIMGYGTTPAQRDILLLGSITVIGAGLSDSVRCPYGGRLISPCLQTFVVAPPASGKGVLSLVRLLVEPIHDAIRRSVQEQMKKYRQEKTVYEAMGKERTNHEQPQMPPDKMFIISGNNTGTGILQNIMDSDGTGIICETEADTVSAAIGTDYGHWSDTLRKAFDHDRLSYNRRTDHEYREVKKTYLSVLLSGTPAQVKPLIPSAENGLFSRQLFYYMPAIHRWQNQFDSNDTNLEGVFTEMGQQWKQQLDAIKANGVYTLRLSDGQKDEFNRLFHSLFIRSGIVNGSEMSSTVARLAINTCRIMSVVALLRAGNAPVNGDNGLHGPLIAPDRDTAADNLKDGIVSRWDIFITPTDFRAVLSLVKPLYRHATHILSFLPSTEISRRSNADRDALFSEMNVTFTRKELLVQAEKAGIPTASASTWLQRMTKRGVVASVDGNGTYRKIFNDKE